MANITPIVFGTVLNVLSPFGEMNIFVLFSEGCLGQGLKIGLSSSAALHTLHIPMFPFHSGQPSPCRDPTPTVTSNTKGKWVLFLLATFLRFNTEGQMMTCYESSCIKGFRDVST